MTATRADGAEPSRPDRRAVLGVLGGLLPLGLTACSTAARPTATTGGGVGASAPAGPVTTTASAAATSAPVSAPTPSDPSSDPASDPASAHRPVHLDIPAIRVSTPLVDLGIDPDGALQVPADPERAGWLTTSATPGDTGPAVIAGHLDSRTGPAVFAELARLRVGDVVTVRRADGREVGFAVDGVRTWAKTGFPTDAVYGPAPGPVLRLVTCGGPYLRGRGGYQDNTVVFAS